MVVKINGYEIYFKRVMACEVGISARITVRIEQLKMECVMRECLTRERNLLFSKNCL